MKRRRGRERDRKKETRQRKRGRREKKDWIGKTEIRREGDKGGDKVRDSGGEREKEVEKEGKR